METFRRNDCVMGTIDPDTRIGKTFCEPGKYPSFIGRLLSVSCYPEFQLVNKILILEFWQISL